MELTQELQTWNDKEWFCRKQLEQLLGKLQFVAKCVRPGRIMLLRLRNQLVNTPERGFYWITGQMVKDLLWWRKFLPKYDNVSIMWMQEIKESDQLLQTDSCLTGMGGMSGEMYIHEQFPDWVVQNDSYKIAHLEFLAIIVCLKAWMDRFLGKRFMVKCDNIALVQIINNGSSRDMLLQQLLRELAFVAAVGEFEVVAMHVSGKNNEICDVLSRMHLGQKHIDRFQQLRKDSWTRTYVAKGKFRFSHDW